jgi:hypothetical protein
MDSHLFIKMRPCVSERKAYTRRAFLPGPHSHLGLTPAGRLQEIHENVHKGPV